MWIVKLLRHRSRKAIRLGKVPNRDEEFFKTKAESLLSTKLMGNSPDRETSIGLAELSDDLFVKLAKAGLVELRSTQKETVPTVGRVLEQYLKRRTDDVKNGTRMFYGHTMRSLRVFFPGDKPLSEVNEGDAQDFRRHLQTVEKLSAATVVRRCMLARTFFKDAIRCRLIDSNPFDEVGKGSSAERTSRRLLPFARMPNGGF